MGIAKHPSKMRPEDYKRILGVAWGGSEGKDLSMINVAVGLNTNDVADLVAQTRRTTERNRRKWQN
jgi:hypothetical protein